MIKIIHNFLITNVSRSIRPITDNARHLLCHAKRFRRKHRKFSITKPRQRRPKFPFTLSWRRRMPLTRADRLHLPRKFITISTAHLVPSHSPPPPSFRPRPVFNEILMKGRLDGGGKSCGALETVVESIPIYRLFRVLSVTNSLT